MGSSGSSSTWLTVFEEKKQTVHETFGSGQGSEAVVHDGRSFRAALEALDRRRKQYKQSRLDAKLLPTYKSVAELCIAVRDSAAELKQRPHDDDLGALVWWTSFALLEVRTRFVVACPADRFIARFESWS